MYRKCVTENAVRNQRRTEQTLLEMMQRLPYEDITVTALCREAQISRRVFYHLFNNKNGALYALVDHAILDSASYRPELRDDALRFFCYWKDRRQLLDVLQENRLIGVLMERILVCIQCEEYEVRRWLQKNGWEREQDVIIFHVSGIIGLVYRWYFSGFRESPEEMAGLLQKIMTTPLARNG